MGAPDAVYAFVVFLGAFLSFQVELVLGKYILPWFGGTPAVFMSCIFFFQIVLLAGYGYVHVGSRIASRRTAGLMQIAALLAALASLLWRVSSWPSPITPGPAWKPRVGDNPAWSILALLAAGVGLPYFVLSSTSPALQRWYSLMQGRRRSPYLLYAVSNAGSLLGLVTYPSLVEPALTVRHQGVAWSIGFGVFAATFAYLVVAFMADPGPALDSIHDTSRAKPANLADPGESQLSDAQTAETSGGLPLRLRYILLWTALAGCASAMLLATTNQICQNLASVPLLWVLPLTLYLLSFVLCFSGDRGYSRRVWSWVLAIATVSVCHVLYAGTHQFRLELAIYSSALLACCMVCHGEAVRLKPPAAHLTSFYLSIAAGGALGSAFVLFLAPRLFKNFFWELHVSLWTCWVLLTVTLLLDKGSWLRSGRPWLLGLSGLVACAGPLLGKWRPSPGNLFAAATVLAGVTTAFYLARRPTPAPESTGTTVAKAGIALALLALFLPIVGFTHPIAVSRNFYGILTVLEEGDRPTARSYVLKHGRTLHGLQFLSGSRKDQPTTYYCKTSGVGLALLNQRHSDTGALRIGVVGLGAGTLAAYGQPGDYFRFYEIDPDVIRLAEHYFSFMRDSAARVEVVYGDARISMERELEQNRPQRFDVLAVDAFTGGAIPVHLLTREALAVYLRHLEPAEGILAVHISNDAVDLRPVLAALGRYFHLSPIFVESWPTDDGCRASSWVLMARSPRTLSQPALAQAGSPLVDSASSLLWTDDYSNLFRVLRH
ncbi:MAG: hypothetical protein DMG26_06175 [Acidobacteria bacterium]|nr:MAG: hypothetical protein DMG26_06175 [Acidobacteriota bacterium]